MTRFTWPKVYEFLEISYSSSKICVKSVAVDMLDSTREGRHGAVELFWNRKRISVLSKEQQELEAREPRKCKWEGRHETPSLSHAPDYTREDHPVDHF